MEGEGTAGKAQRGPALDGAVARALAGGVELLEDVPHWARGVEVEAAPLRLELDEAGGPPSFAPAPPCSAPASAIEPRSLPCTETGNEVWCCVLCDLHPELTMAM